MYFCNFVIFSHWKRAGPFIWTNMNPLYPRMLCAKFGWYWPSGSGIEDETMKSLRQQRQRRQRQRRRTTDKFYKLNIIVLHVTVIELTARHTSSLLGKYGLSRDTRILARLVSHMKLWTTFAVSDSTSVVLYVSNLDITEWKRVLH